MAHMPKSKSASRATSTSRERQIRLQESFQTPQPPETSTQLTDAGTSEPFKRRSRRASPDFEGFQQEVRRDIRELRELFAQAALQDEEGDWTAQSLATIAEASNSPRASARDKHELDFLKRLVCAPTEEEVQEVITARLRTLAATTIHGWSFAVQIQNYERCERLNIPCQLLETPAPLSYARGRGTRRGRGRTGAAVARGRGRSRTGVRR